MFCVWLLKIITRVSIWFSIHLFNYLYLYLMLTWNCFCRCFCSILKFCNLVNYLLLKRLILCQFMRSVLFLDSLLSLGIGFTYCLA